MCLDKLDTLHSCIDTFAHTAPTHTHAHPSSIARGPVRAAVPSRTLLLGPPLLRPYVILIHESTCGVQIDVR